ncbi:MAG: pseudouridine synthase [Patescibacteria group bacterium]
MKKQPEKYVHVNKNTAKTPVEEKPLWPMRINKFLALNQISTRRGGDSLIQQKKVTINGRIAVLGDKVNEADIVDVRQGKNDKKIPYVYLAYYKPSGVISHTAQVGEKDILHSASLKKSYGDIFPVGRLDKESHGLIILTNDGRITDPLLNPDRYHTKEYLVTVKEKLRSSFRQKMESGVNINGEMTKPCKVQVINDFTFRITLTEGKKHQIRRMCDALFQEVDELKRTKIMNIELGKLAPNSYREITGKELETFLGELKIRQ